MPSNVEVQLHKQSSDELEGVDGEVEVEEEG